MKMTQLTTSLSPRCNECFLNSWKVNTVRGYNLTEKILHFPKVDNNLINYICKKTVRIVNNRKQEIIRIRFSAIVVKQIRGQYLKNIHELSKHQQKRKT